MPFLFAQQHTSHVSKFFTSSFQVVPIFSLHGILYRAGYGVIQAQDRALNQPNLPRRIAPKIIRCRCLSLPPRFGGAGFTP